MDEAGVDKTVLFCTAPHPEKAGTLSELEVEMAVLNKILGGSNTKDDNISRLKKNIAEVAETDAPYGEPYLYRQLIEFISPDKSTAEMALGENISRLLELH